MSVLLCDSQSGQVNLPLIPWHCNTLTRRKSKKKMCQLMTADFYEILKVNFPNPEENPGCRGGGI